MAGHCAYEGPGKSSVPTQHGQVRRISRRSSNWRSKRTQTPYVATDTSTQEISVECAIVAGTLAWPKRPTGIEEVDLGRFYALVLGGDTCEYLNLAISQRPEIGKALGSLADSCAGDVFSRPHLYS